MSDETIGTYPNKDHLVDMFHGASPGIIVTSRDGRVVLANPAARLLLDSELIEGGDLIAGFGLADHPAIHGGNTARNVKVSFVNPHFPTGFATVGFGAIAHSMYGFWALRPSTSSPTPHPDFMESDTITSGRAWADAVIAEARLSRPVDDVLTMSLIKGFYDYCPVGIHFVAPNGTVAYANPEDVGIVGASQSPYDYVGHHIRRAYADQEIIDDFVARWDDNDPIIDFRANFLNNGAEVPVVIFSTARMRDGILHNTRCFVFADDQPERPRDRVSGIELDVF
jgi:PAS domain-containing protein